MENNIKIVIFDLDGTLIHLPIEYERLRCEISRILKVNKVDSIVEILSNVGKDTRMKVFDIWDDLELKALSCMKEINEGIKIYNRFNGKFRCLITLQGRRVVERILEKTGLSFDYIVTRENSLNRGEQIRIIIEEFRVNPKEVLVVGDRESDKEAAEKAGCMFIFIGGI
jgi:HAD superfamily hydrolase (TIGR01549 family)